MEMVTDVRVIVIDPLTRTVTEQRLKAGGNVLANIALANLMGISPHTKTKSPIQNDGTGDHIIINPSAPPTYMFLDQPVGGISVIVGRTLAHNVIVPLARVKSQVEWHLVPIPNPPSITLGVVMTGDRRILKM